MLHELLRSKRHFLFCVFICIHPHFTFCLFFVYPRCTMRIGKGIHPDGVPGWCQGFSLDGGSGVRAVKVIQHGNRPGLIYNIGKWFYAHQHQCLCNTQTLMIIMRVNSVSGAQRPEKLCTSDIVRDIKAEPQKVLSMRCKV